MKRPNKVKNKKSKASSLSQNLCRVSALDGHNDLITSLVVAGDRLITARYDIVPVSGNFVKLKCASDGKISSI